MNEKKNKIINDITIYRCVSFIPADVIMDCPTEEVKFSQELKKKNTTCHNLWWKIRFYILKTIRHSKCSKMVSIQGINKGVIGDKTGLWILR